jgi:conjugal transfer pilus assembly protein TraB
MSPCAPVSRVVKKASDHRSWAAMSLSERWERLSPGLRHALVLGGAIALLLALASLLVSAPIDERGGRGGERRRLITNLLTDADPRAIGIEGLAERLRRLESHMDQLAIGLEKLGLGKGVDPERDALIEGLRRENARQLEELRRQQEALREQLEAESTKPTRQPAEAALPPVAMPPAEQIPNPPCAPRPLDRLFDPMPEGQQVQPAPTRLPAIGAEVARGPKSLQIRLVAAEPKQEGDELPEDAVLIPAGSILRGVLLSGMDAPTGRQSRRDPYPALARIKHAAILPRLPLGGARVPPGARRLRGPRERAGLPQVCHLKDKCQSD